ncbi:MAG: O-antigen ligase family protein [Actinomycetota bacterium]|nr:O-antigen ligase family protein [Actinomycetota bacterium]
MRKSAEAGSAGDIATPRIVSTETLLWLLGTVIAGAIAGYAVSRGTTLAVGLLGIAAAGLILWRFEIGTVLMVVTLPLDMYGRVLSSGSVTITAFHVMLGLTLVSWAVALAWRVDAKVRFSIVDIGMALLVLAAVWSLPFSLDRRDTIVAIIRLAFLWAFVLLYANAMSSRRVFGWVASALMVTGAASSAFALAQYFLPDFDYGNVIQVRQGGVVMRRVGALFDDPNYFAGFASLAFIVALGYLLHARRSRVVAPLLGCCALCGGAVLVTFSRTGWVGVAVGAVVLVMTAPPKRRLWLVILGGVLVAAVFAARPEAIIERIASIGDVGGDNSIGTRYYMVGSSVEMIRDYWTFGTGLSAYDVAFPAYRAAGTLSGVIRPHQLPLALWAEMGMAGIIAEVVLVWTLVRTFVRRRLASWTVAESFAAAGLVSLLVQSLFQYYLYFDYLWLFVAFAIAANRLAARDEETDRVN